jgi:translation initiation factor IF-2
MAGKKIRLFKIASEINIGKDTIVDFLKGKGFDIENKSTASLTPDMQDAVYDKFKKEKRAAEVQRTKIQKHKETKKSSDETQPSAKAETQESTSDSEPPEKSAAAKQEAETPESTGEPSSPAVVQQDDKLEEKVETSAESQPDKSEEVSTENNLHDSQTEESSEKTIPASTVQTKTAQSEKSDVKAETPEGEQQSQESTLKENIKSDTSVKAADEAKTSEVETKSEILDSSPKEDQPGEVSVSVETSAPLAKSAEPIEETKSDTSSDSGGDSSSSSTGKAEPKAGEVIDLSSISPTAPKPKKKETTVSSDKPKVSETPKPASRDNKAKARPAAKGSERKAKQEKPKRKRASDIEIKRTYSGKDDPNNVTKIEASSPRPVETEPDTDAPSAENKLKGLKVMGKIELKTEEPRKRKRSRKGIDVSKEIKKGKEGGAKGRGPGAGRPGAPRTVAKEGDRTPRERTGGRDSAPNQGGGGQPQFRNAAAPPRGAGGRESEAERRKKKRGKSIRDQISQKEVNRAIKQTLSGYDGGGKQSYKKRKAQKREEKELQEQEQREIDAKTLELTEFVTTSDLANLMNVSVTDVIAKCMMLGRMVTINQRLDKETIELIATDYEFEVEFIEEVQFTQIEDEEDAEEDLQSRSPIVTIMGHVDHGKTSLLDYIREASVVAGEAGGITQHIGAYMVDHQGKKITFLDTPGHEAFTAMRARGAEVTDIVVLVVAADDSVMPQTLEAISHAKAAEVPMVVAINKVDKTESNIEKIKQQLAEHDVLVEDWGGKYQAVPISAKFGTNIDQLLESILLEAELLDLKANPDRLARATVVEAHMDKGLGSVATVVMQKGTLEVGQPFIAGATNGRIRAMFDEREHRIDKAGPSVPVRIIGFDATPDTGDILIAMKSDSEAKNVAQQRQQLKREQELRQKRHVTLDDIATQIALGGVQTLNLILKGDVSGSIEALSDSLLKLSTQEVKVNIIHRGVGAISESDVQLAMASDAVIIGFHQSPSPKAKALADIEKVEIREYDIIYAVVEDIENALEGLLAPDLEENIKGRAEIRLIYRISRMGNIAGCYVLEGKIQRNDKVRLMRDGIKIWEGGIQTLKREKDDVKEVREGFECGIFLDGYNDINEEDVIEAFEMVEVKRTLSQSK